MRRDYTLGSILLGLGVSIGCSTGHEVAIPGHGVAELGIATSCESRSIGSVELCAEATVLRAEAFAICESQGQSLGQIGFASKCDGGWGVAKFDCCGLAELVMAEAPVDEEQSCSVKVVGGKECLPEGELISAAVVACGDAAVTDVSWGTECKGGWQYAKVACCTQPQEEPPVLADTSPCHDVDVSVGGVCAEPASLEARGRGFCSGSGLLLSKFALVGDCGDGTFAGAKATCCEAAAFAEEVPAPSLACTTGIAGGPDSCRTESEWQTHAEAACAQQGLAVSAFQTAGACSKGRSQTAQFSCCPRFRAEEACMQQQVGGDGYCAGAVAWESAAANLCQSVGRTVAAMGVQESCGPGLWRGANVACCAVQAEFVAASDPNAEKVDQCFASTVKVAACQSDSQWQDVARDLCGIHNAAFEGVDPGAACVTGGSDTATIRCCAGTNEGPKQCAKRTVRLPLQCADDATIAELAKSVCELSGQKLREVVAGLGCEGGNGQSVTFDCCAE